MNRGPSGVSMRCGTWFMTTSSRGSDSCASRPSRSCMNAIDGPVSAAAASGPATGRRRDASHCSRRAMRRSVRGIADPAPAADPGAPGAGRTTARWSSTRSGIPSAAAISRVTSSSGASTPAAHAIAVGWCSSSSQRSTLAQMIRSSSHSHSQSRTRYHSDVPSTARSPITPDAAAHSSSRSEAARIGSFTASTASTASRIETVAPCRASGGGVHAASSTITTSPGPAARGTGDSHSVRPAGSWRIAVTRS